MTPPQSTNLEQDFDRLRSRLCNEDFLHNRGLGNEVGFFIFPYDAKQELEVRRRAAELVAESQAGKLPCNIVERNLWEVLLDVCREWDVLDALPELEEDEGPDAVMDCIGDVADAEALVAAMDYEPHEPGRDVLLITGVGQVYPFTRAHAILENAQHVFEDIPVVLMYPGRYDGQQLHLFDRISDGNYYRAFNIL